MNFPMKDDYYIPDLRVGTIIKPVDTYCLQKRTEWGIFDNNDLDKEFRQFQFDLDSETMIYDRQGKFCSLVTKSKVIKYVPLYLLLPRQDQEDFELRYAIHHESTDKQRANWKVRTLEQAEIVFNDAQTISEKHKISDLREKRGLWLL